jgi:predicted phage tail protein
MALSQSFLTTPSLQNPDGSYNFQDVTIYTRNGTQSQTYIPLVVALKTKSLLA